VDRLPLTLVSLDSGTLTGAVCLKLHDMESRLDLAPWLAGLYVSGPWRGRGIGSKLMDAIEQEARGLGYRVIFLYTPDSEEFYLRNGWKSVEKTRSGSGRVTLMEKGIGG
jgi:N-acetylglutamate synthase-like GNAT family acetyltransferase